MYLSLNGTPKNSLRICIGIRSDLLFLGTIEVRTKTGALGIVNSVVHPGIVRNLFIDKSTLYIDR